MEDRNAQLAWERRFGPWAAGAAFAAVVLGLASQILAASTGTRSGDGDRVALRKLHEHAGEQTAAAIAQSLSVVFLVLVLFYLLRCIRSRRAEALPPAIGILLVLAPLLYTAGNLLSVANAIDVADKFAGGAQTEARADALLDTQSRVGAFVGLAGTFALAFSLFLISLNALRVGLLTRFMGILGIVLAALFVIPLLGGPTIIEIFWLGALGSIFLGRWPGGRGEAWETGEAGVWLSAAEQRRQQMRAEQLEAEPPPGSEPDEGPEDLDERPHPVSKKRRKKRKR